MRSGLLRHSIKTLRLRLRAPYPSQLRLGRLMVLKHKRHKD